VDLCRHASLWQSYGARRGLIPTKISPNQQGHRLAGQPTVGGERQEDRDTGLLHGRPDGISHVRGDAGPRRRGRLVPRRWPCYRPAEQPTFQAAKTKAQFLIAIASNDDQRSPDEKNVLKETFEKANLPAEIEVYSGAHGWCPPDSRVYNEPDAERAWTRLLALYGKALRQVVRVILKSFDGAAALAQVGATSVGASPRLGVFTAQATNPTAPRAGRAQ
jgi:Dienelactone hydrolase family